MHENELKNWRLYEKNSCSLFCRADDGILSCLERRWGYHAVTYTLGSTIKNLKDVVEEFRGECVGDARCSVGMN